MEIVRVDTTALPERGASVLAARVRRALSADRDARASLAVSGGKGPWPMLAALARHDLDWSRVDLFQVDERVAPDGHDDRNLTHLRRTFDAPVRWHPMPVTDPDLASAARRYDRALPAQLDVVHLGLGPDGHTASLVPGDPVLDEQERLVAITGVYEGRVRMTLTYRALAAAASLVWYVGGAGKDDALARLVAGDPAIPAGRVERRRALLVTDRPLPG